MTRAAPGAALCHSLTNGSGGASSDNGDGVRHGCASIRAHRDAVAPHTRTPPDGSYTNGCGASNGGRDDEITGRADRNANDDSGRCGRRCTTQKGQGDRASTIPIKNSTPQSFSKAGNRSLRRKRFSLPSPSPKTPSKPRIRDGRPARERKSFMAVENKPLMPKATAVWLVDNTSLTFEQIADFCGLHPLEVKGHRRRGRGQGHQGPGPGHDRPADARADRGGREGTPRCA